MKRLLTFIVMFGLLVTNNANAEYMGDDSSGVNKFLGLMSQAGIDNPALKETANFIDQRIDNKKFRITEHSYAGYNLSLTHDVSMPDYKDIQLNITYDESNYSLKGRHAGVMLNYNYQFPIQ